MRPSHGRVCWSLHPPEARQKKSTARMKPPSTPRARCARRPIVALFVVGGTSWPHPTARYHWMGWGGARGRRQAGYVDWKGEGVPRSRWGTEMSKFGLSIGGNSSSIVTESSVLCDMWSALGGQCVAAHWPQGSASLTATMGPACTLANGREVDCILMGFADEGTDLLQLMCRSAARMQ